MRIPSVRPISTAPSKFEGKLSEFFERYAQRVLPEPSEVEYHHTKLMESCEGEDPLFIVRYLTSMTRGQVYQTRSGARFKPSDNAPAWWMHALTFNRIRHADYADAPTHMFEVARAAPANINTEITPGQGDRMKTVLKDAKITLIDLRVRFVKAVDHDGVSQHHRAQPGPVKTGGDRITRFAFCRSGITSSGRRKPAAMRRWPASPR
jgi:hypothetical protein